MKTLSATISIKSACDDICDGINLALSPACRLYVIIPVLVNMLFMSFCGYCLYHTLSGFTDAVMSSLPSFLSFLGSVIAYVLAALIIFLCCYFFSTVATIIASPFYGLLADKAEMVVNGTHGDDMTVFELIKDVPRILCREFKKQMFFLFLAIICLCLTFIPAVNLVSPLMWFALTSYICCIQYTDYTYDNHKIQFKYMRQDLNRSLGATLTIGALTSVLLSVPVLNILVPPAAVCTGVRYYIRQQLKIAKQQV